MRRRELIRLLGSAAVAWPLAARAQQPDRMQRIGVLMGYAESNVEGQAFVAAFREELLKLGWAEGRNLRSHYRWAPPGDAETTRRFAKELVALQPNLILAHNTPATAAALEQTHTIPIRSLRKRDHARSQRSERVRTRQDAIKMSVPPRMRKLFSQPLVMGPD